MGHAPSEGGIEDVAAMLEKAPEFNDYWARKRAAVEKIGVPTYVPVSWGGKLTLEAPSRAGTAWRPGIAGCQ